MTDIERGRALLEARREQHREWVIFDNTNRRFVLCAECKQSWPCEQSFMLDLALAVDRRRQAEMVREAADYLTLSREDAVAIVNAPADESRNVDAALGKMLAHLAGEGA
jgi:hypothetical protein